MKKENTEQQKQIYSIRKNKAYGASSVLIGLMGSAFLLSGLAPTVQAEENDAKPETKPVDGSAVNGTNAPTVETEHLIIASQPKESKPKPKLTPTDTPKSDVGNAPTNVTNPLNSESPQPKEEAAAPVNPTEGAKPAAPGTTEAKPTEETTPAKRSVSIVYKVRYVDRKSHKVVHEVTKTKTVETTEAKAKASVTEIGAELANDSQLENYYVPDGNPTTMTKEIVEGEDNVFVYEVEGFGEAETPKERTVALKYTVEYVDKKSGLVLASEEKEEKVSTTETVAKKEVTIQPSLTANEKLKDWVLSDGAPASQKLTLTEGTVGKVTFKLQNSEGGKVRNKRKVEYPTSPVTGQPYLTLENQTEGYISKENITFVGNGRNTYNLKYKIGFTNIAASDLELTQGAKDLGFSLDLAGGLITSTLTPTRDKAGNYEVGFQSISHPEVKVSGRITILAKNHVGFMVFTDDSEVPLYPNNVDEGVDLYDAGRTSGRVGDRYGAPYNEDKANDRYGYYTPIIQNRQNFTRAQVDGGVYDSERWSYGPVSPKENVVLGPVKIPTTPFGYFMRKRDQTVENATADTKRYYTMFPIFASLDRSTDYNNNKKGLTIKDFQVLSASAGVEAKLVDLSKDKAPDKGFYSNTVDFQTMPEYDSETGRLKDDQRNSVSRTPYYLQFTKLPQTAGNYSVKFKITDSEGLVKTFTMDFTTYENFNSSSRSYENDTSTYTYALTNADALFEPNEENVDKTTNKIAIPISNEKQILGKVVLNKDNAYLEADVFPAGITLEVDEKKRDKQGRPTEAYVVKEKGRKVALGKYTFSVKAHDGHYQTGAPRSFEFEIIDGVNPIGPQRWKEGSVPTPISVSMEHHSKITGIRVEASGGYAIFEGDLTKPNDPKIAIYGLKRTQETQTARVYVTFTDGAGQTRQTYTDFTYEIEPNTEADFSVTVTHPNQEIPEGGTWQPMVITTTGENVKIKVDSTKLPKGTRVTDYIVDGAVVGKQIVGKGRYEGVYNVPILAVKGDRVKATAVSLKVTPGTFTVEPETAEVEVLSNNIKAVTTDENGETVKTPVSSYGLQNAPDDAKVTYSGGYEFTNYSGLSISSDGTEITGTPTKTGSYTLDATVVRKDSNGRNRTTTTTYTINVIGLTPTLTISSAAQPEHPTDAYTSEETSLKAPLGTAIQPITIQHDPHSNLDLSYLSNLPKGLSYSYDAANHTATITGTPSEMSYGTSVIRVAANMEYQYVASGVSNPIVKYIYIQVKPITSNLTIDHAKETFPANRGMTPIEVSDFDSRATIDLKYAPAGVTYNRDTHQITGSPTSGVGEHKFYVRAIMPSSLGGSVTEKEIVLNVTELEPTLTANKESVTITAKDEIPTITVKKDSLSTLSEPTVTIEGISGEQPLSRLGLSYTANSETTGTITGTPTIVGSHTIHLSTTLERRYSGFYYGKTTEVNIPLIVNRKEFNFIEDQNRRTTVLSAITPVELNVPEGIEVSVSELPSGLRYDATNKRIEGIPDKVGTYTVTVKARPNGITGNDKTATVTIQVNPLTAGITISNNGQNVQVGTQMNSATVTPSEHASVYGTDALLNAFSSAVNEGDSGIDESHIANYFLGSYGLTYNPTTHTITGTPTKTGRIVFTFIARNSKELGSAEARETFVLNVVESLSKIPVITEAQEGSNAVKGSGVAGATVTVTLPDGAVKTAEVATDGTWTVETTTPLVKGQSISARQKEVNKTESNDISATVVGNSGLVPSKEALVDAVVDEATTVTGKGENGSTITVTRPDGTVKTATVSEGTWSVTLDKAAVKGENILVTQTEPNKATSPAVTATVVPKITKGDQGKPGETGPKGEQGEPGTPGVPGKDGFTPEISVTPNDDGSYTITITQPDGKKPIKTTVKNGTNGINGRDGRTPKVKLTPIYEDPAHPRTRRTRSAEDREAQPTGKQIGVHITVYFDNNENGTYDEGDDLISEENIYDGVDGIDGRDGTNGTNGTDGVAGATGAAGRDGRDGKDILNGTENPGENQGKDGDTFVNTKTGEVFVKENGIWKPAGNIRGPKGDDGKDILNGKTDPTSEIGKDGDKYVNTETGDIFVKENGTWKSAGNIKGPKGDKGENGTNGTDGRDGTNGTNGTDGVAGATGAAGRDGRDGKDILNGTENPGENQGKDGDTFVNTKTGEVFVKENGIWKPAGNIRGPKGDDGKDILNGKTDPTSEIGKDGDKYVNTETGDIFVKENGTWKSAGNIKGPKGDKGENGTNGTDGRDGTNGTNGTDGVAGATGAAGHDGRDGKDGQSPTVTVRENTDGSHTIVITNPNGNTIETTVRDGKSPTVTVRENTDGTHTITIENADGKMTTTTVRDGKNGQSPTVSIRNNNDGTHTVTIINPDGSKTEAVIKDGKDGKDGQSPTVSVTNNGNGTHTIIITSSDGKVTTTVIKDGKCGCNDKPGGSTPGEPTRENSTTPNPGAPTPGGSTTPNPGAPTPGGSTTPSPGAPTPGGSTTPNPGVPTPGGSTTPNPGAPTPGGSTTPNPGAPTPGGSTTPNPGASTPGGSTTPNPGAPTPGGSTPNPNQGAPTPGGSTRPNPNSDEDPEMPEPPVHELPEYPLEIPNTLEDSTNPNPGGSTTPNPGAPTPGGTLDRNPGGEPGTNQGALTPGTTPNQPVNPPEVSITVNEHPYGELPKTGTATDHLSILLGSGILLSLYVGKRKEEES